MITEEQASYIINDILLLEFNYKVETIEFSDTNILIKLNNFLHTEEKFNFNNPEISDSADLKILDEICDEIDATANLNYNKYISINIPILKISHFFVNEYYLNPDLHFDSHNRISSVNVNPRYVRYLNYPIVDILKNIFLHKVNLQYLNNSYSVFYTSDYDILNYWDTLGLKGGLKRFVKNVYGLHFIKLIKELPSYFLSKYILYFSYLLNTKMFNLPNNLFYSKKKINTYKYAFWLVWAQSNVYDPENNFNTFSFKRFKKKLLKENVLFGLHPNYTTLDKKYNLQFQIKKFEEIFGFTPQNVKLHYLRFKSNDDFYLLQINGIKYDYSYAFPDSLLFRGARSCPVKFWNKNKNKPIDLISHPLTLMDTTLTVYLNLTFQESLSLTKRKLYLSWKFGSSCVLLWHNTSFIKWWQKNNYLDELYKLLVDYQFNYLFKEV